MGGAGMSDAESARFVEALKQVAASARAFAEAVKPYRLERMRRRAARGWQMRRDVILRHEIRRRQ